MTITKRRGFTLIELLVVIAIIAILAAILFPVFAQAKRAAKGAVAISDAKQMNLAELMYTNDYDDAFPLILRVDKSYQEGGGIYYWSYLCQPYMKNWGILADPTGPNVLAGSQDNSGFFNAFALYGMWGMPPERTDSGISATAADWTFGQQALGSAMTGGKLWYYDGIAGVGMNACSWWSTWYYKGGCGAGGSTTDGQKPGSNSSLTTSQVANPADQVMLAQSGNADFMWEDNGNGSSCDLHTTVCADTPDSFDLYYGGCGSNAYGCNYTICAPIARQRDSDGNSVGFFGFPAPGANIPAGTTLPTGLTVWAGTDGHVKATPWRQLMGTTIPINGGADLAIKAFWPQGS